MPALGPQCGTNPISQNLAESHIADSEGPASYVSLRTALLLKDSGYEPGIDPTKDPFFYDFAYVGGYIDNVMRKGMDFANSMTQDDQRKYYLYGAYQCFLLDRTLKSPKEVKKRSKVRSLKNRLTGPIFQGSIGL